MEFSEVIKKRRSVRNFKEVLIDEKILEKIIQDGYRAPSSGNLKAWEFIVVTSKDLIESLARSTYRGNQKTSKEYQNWIKTAPAIIVLIYKKEPMFKKYGELGVDKYLYLDGSACMENMLLSAVDSGLGACYVAGFRHCELRNLLKIDDRYEVIGFMPIGFPEGEEMSKKAIKSSDIQIHKEYCN